MECNKCKQQMDEESEEFCKEYDIDWCLKCCGEDYEKNAEAGIYYHMSIPVTP